MVDRHLLRACEPAEDQLQEALASLDNDNLEDALLARKADPRPNRLLRGTVAAVDLDVAHIDIGFKSPGTIPLREWFDGSLQKVVPPRVGDEVEVLLTGMEDSGTPQLSYRLARFHHAWEAFVSRHRDGDTVTGRVTREVKGGLVVDIGIDAFLPASQADIRRPTSLAGFIGRTIECRILRISHERRTVLVSRRATLSCGHPMGPAPILAELEPGQLRQGVVKNIADFGAFVDLGGIDGLLHVTDMSWTRVNSPHEVVHLDQQLEVYILSVDRPRERITLSLKHRTPSPWSHVLERYPVGSHHTGEVASVMPYGAFVRLEPGIEGLVHISEMAWTRRISHPSELVSVGDPVEVKVLNVNPEKQEISLSMKQVMPSPWDSVAERYHPQMVVTGVVRNLTSYGAFVEIEEGIDGLLHVTDLSPTRKVAHPSEVLRKGDRVLCNVLAIDQDRRRMLLGLRQPSVPAAWLTPSVTAIARVIDREGRFEELPILADALEDAGCEDADLLGYLRGPGPHVRDCWAAGLVLD